MIEDKDLKISDVLEVAIRLERFGLKFFNSISDLKLPEEVTELFSFLANEEEKHVGFYAAMLDKAAEYHPQYKYPGEYGKYLDSYAKMVFMKIVSSSRFSNNIKEMISLIDYRSKLFFEKLAELHDIRSGEDALNIAREIEIAAIVFYSEVVPLFKDDDQNLVRLIIKEEKEHLKKLNEMLKRLLNSDINKQ